jgi:nicotinate phosphoribosyltransferase
MTACYCGEGLDQRWASFELFTRRLPDSFSYGIAMGLAQAVDYLQQLQFTSEDIQWLRSSGIFDHAPPSFWTQLTPGKKLFTGNLWALPEGTVFFPHEPLLRIEAPLWQAQLVETYLLNTLNYQTLIATRAARLRALVGPAVQLLEFGTRRAFSPQASLWAARAALAAGFSATSNVLAAQMVGQVPSGTMAHAFVMALAALQGTEDQAFQAFHHYFPNAALLIDTYDPFAAIEHLAQRVKAGDSVPAVRLDSGDLVSLYHAIRTQLPGTQVFASGDLDEDSIQALQEAGAQMDGYGIGTKLVTGQPINGVYKLVDIEGIPVMKESSGKATYPGRKQIYRTVVDGQLQQDRLSLMTEAPLPGETPLLMPMMSDGKWLKSPEPVTEIAQRVDQNLRSLPPALRDLRGNAPPPVKLSSALMELTEQTRRTLPGRPLSFGESHA